MKLTINKHSLIFGFVIWVFILSEYCFYFYWLDSLHVKHLLYVFVVCIYGIFMIKEGIIVSHDVKMAIKTAFFLYIISLIFQILHMEFKLYSVMEVYYLILPAIFCWIVINYSNGDIDGLMTSILIVCFFSFILTRIHSGVLNFNNIKLIFNFKSLFIDSISPINESDLSNFFLLLFLYFAFRHYKFRCFISALGTIVGYKRFAVFYLVLLLLMLRFIPFNKMVDKRIPILLTVVFCLAPFLVFFICTDEFALWFYTKFGLDFNKFTMTRFDIINTVIDANLPNYGLGTVTDYLERRGVPGQTNMHNDILRIYMECTLLGSIIFTKNYFKMAEKNWFSLLTMIFIFMELFVAHFLGPGTISFWTIAYLDIYTFNNDYRNSLSF